MPRTQQLRRLLYCNGIQRPSNVAFQVGTMRYLIFVSLLLCSLCFGYLRPLRLVRLHASGGFVLSFRFLGFTRLSHALTNWNSLKLN